MMAKNKAKGGAGDRLATPWVFFDTEAFRAAGLDWKSRAWASLAELSASGIVRPKITDITAREVESRISEALSEAEAAVQKHRSVLKQLGIFLGESDHDKRLTVLKKAFRKFLKEGRFQEIPITATASDIFDAYFEAQPPFGAGRKKHEFPDAFVLHSLRQWTNMKKTDVYVVSRDPDVLAFCENEARFIHSAGLPEFLSLARAHGDLLKALENHVHSDKSFIQKIEKALGRYKPVSSALDVEDIDFEDLEITSVLLIDEDPKTREFLVEIEIVSSVRVEVHETGLGMIVDHRGEPDIDVVRRRARPEATCYFNVEATITATGEDDASASYEITEWHLGNQEIELELPREFNARRIRLRR